MNKYLVRNFKWRENLSKVPAKVYRLVIDKSLQITLGKKIIAMCHLEFSYFFICTATGIILHFMELVNFSHKYSI